ncbi:hypothetical protein JCGZ_08569 [Jatropha curcas]|uniref:Uncharacterized protein n=1 Tax=Jatropha curcas TaxID=180498 RepID=A0A067KZV0_JATCU|nr:hypothetical protein JCGZ_08569 [Jatropha curcas]
MVNDSAGHPNTEGQDNSNGEATRQPILPPPPTIDPQMVAALVQAYSQFTIVLKRLLEIPHPNGDMQPQDGLRNQCHREKSAPPPSPKPQSHPVSERHHEAESEVNLSMIAPYSQEPNHTQPVLDNANLQNMVKELVKECREIGEIGDYALAGLTFVSQYSRRSICPKIQNSNLSTI